MSDSVTENFLLLRIINILFGFIITSFELRRTGIVGKFDLDVFNVTLI